MRNRSDSFGEVFACRVKSKLIFKYEIGLSRLIRRSRMSSQAYFRAVGRE